MSTRHSTDSVIEAYTGHPLSHASILARLQRSHLLNSLVRELDLAVDAVEEITDQNHIGGALSTLRLGSLAAFARGAQVLDLGCGIGGPARLLAEVFGCTVHGVDANPCRIADAKDLSLLVGLAGSTSYEQRDFLTWLWKREYSVVWAQNTWIHIDEPERLANIAESALSSAGRLAFEDIYLKRLPSTVEESRALAEVGEAWRSSFTHRNRWLSAIEGAGFRVIAAEEDNELLLAHFEKWSILAGRFPERYPSHEVIGWTGALDLARKGVIGYLRIVGQLP
jgi:2-polyprenyl-3-methyl-5-hydroxy-6-metoxy-1,4-benzoquinol methylase